MRLISYVASITRDAFVSAVRNTLLPASAFHPGEHAVKADPDTLERDTKARRTYLELEDEALRKLPPAERVCMCCHRRIGADGRRSGPWLTESYRFFGDLPESWRSSRSRAASTTLASGKPSSAAS
ncbi:hypothetical protein DFJ74DRAFT_701583 [Hyaloraphidium curvatum]|nr:hypothetical protein DFJ74DRAFT_701583 [Hyaloraphidium curvatum]